MSNSLRPVPKKQVLANFLEKHAVDGSWTSDTSENRYSFTTTIGVTIIVAAGSGKIQFSSRNVVELGRIKSLFAHRWNDYLAEAEQPKTKKTRRGKRSRPKKPPPQPEPPKSSGTGTPHDNYRHIIKAGYDRIARSSKDRQHIVAFSMAVAAAVALIVPFGLLAASNARYPLEVLASVIFLAGGLSLLASGILTWTNLARPNYFTCPHWSTTSTLRPTGSAATAVADQTIYASSSGPVCLATNFLVLQHMPAATAESFQSSFFAPTARRRS